MLIDTHCHIQFKPLSNDIEDVISRANNEGVKKMIVVGCDIKSTEEAIKIAENYEGIFASVGLHPQDSKKLTGEMWEAFKKLASHEKIVAIGETGLDYFKEYSPKNIQISVLKQHIALAKELNKPLIIHNRDADEECLEILQENDIKDAVFHCFGSDVSFARKVWLAGYMTSFTGIITYPTAHNLREVVEECPPDAMMIETDCPYLSPQKFRGKTNEPSYVLEIALEMARIKNVPFSEIAEITTKNAEEFFGI
ncbi:TatD family hydrolase [Patescibacteria group bacterium]